MAFRDGQKSPFDDGAGVNARIYIMQRHAHGNAVREAVADHARPAHPRQKSGMHIEHAAHGRFDDIRFQNLAASNHDVVGRKSLQHALQPGAVGVTRENHARLKRRVKRFVVPLKTKPRARRPKQRAQPMFKASSSQPERAHHQNRIEWNAAPREFRHQSSGVNTVIGQKDKAGRHH